MVPYRLTVLGPPQLHAPDGEVVRFRTRKQFALMMYFAVEPSIPHRRDRLATLLWEDSDLDEARHSLATALCLLRARLGSGAFDATRDAVRLIPGTIASDVAQLEHDDPAEGDIANMGPFLEEFDLDESPNFQHWKDTQRARLVPLLHSALAQRINFHRRRGDARRMEALAQQLFRVDDLSEEAMRAQLEGRAMGGDRIGALRVFDRWRVRLHDELGALPSTAIDRIAERLRRNHWERPEPAEATVRTAEWQEHVFVGRGRDFSTCYDLWERARDGEPRHLLLRGEPGIGKTTLIDRLVTTLSLEGATVARVRCYALERELPFGLISGLVNRLLDLPGANCTAPHQLAELGRLVSRVRQLYPSLPEPQPSVRESARMLLTEAVLALVTSLAEEHPVVMVVDDMHLGDVTSLAVLHLLLRRVEQLPLMVVLASSSAREGDTPEIRRFIDHADAIGLTTLHLDPLPDDEAEELLDVLLAGGDASSALRREFLSGARGNPMVLELLVGDWRRQGDACVALAFSAMTSATGMAVEDAFHRAVDLTLSTLDPEARAVAEMGAILGKRLNELALYGLINVPIAQTMRAMTTLATHRILRDSGSALEFANEFVRGQCYMAMAVPLRRVLHGSVADRLLADTGADAPIPGLEIAWHLVRADRLAEAVPHLLTGSREAIHRTGSHEAELALSTGLPALTGEPRRTAILLLAEARQELGNWAESLQLLDLANEPFSESEACGREVFRIIAQRWLGRLTQGQMIEATTTLLNIASREVDIEVRVKALAASVRLLGLTRDEQQLIELDRLATEISPMPMDTFQRLHVILASAWIRAFRQDTATALSEVLRGVQIADEGRVASSITVRLIFGYANLLYLLGRYDEALAPLERALSLCVRLDNRTLKGECACHLALVEGRLGRHEMQINWARQALTLLPPNDWCALATGATYELGLGLAAAGRYVEAQAAVLPIASRKPRDVPMWVIQGGLLCAADVVAMSGNIRKATGFAKRGTTGDMADLHNSSYAGQFARWVALLGAHQPNKKAVRDRLLRAFPKMEELDSKDQAEVLAGLAMLEDGEPTAARRRWKEVERRLSALPPAVGTVMKRLGFHPPRRTK